MRSVPYIRGMAYIPLESVLRLDALRDQLTITAHRKASNSMDQFHYPGEVTDVVGGGERWETVRAECYDLTRPGYIGVPRAFAAVRFPHLPYQQTFARGSTPHPELFPKVIIPKDDLQAKFMADMTVANNERGAVDVFVLSPTGSGKTAVSLKLIADDGIPTIVLVPTNRLKDQWLGSISQRNGMRHFWGADWVDQYAGVAQQDVCEWEGKLVVVALAPSMARREYPPEFYNHFGRVIYDEIHMMTTPGLLPALHKFPARVRIAMSATKRRDAFQNIVNYYFGAVKVRSEIRTRQPTVFIHRYEDRARLNPYSEGAMLNSLARLRRRNSTIAGLILSKYQEGRNIVVLSDRTEQLLQIRGMLLNSRVPDETIGMFVGKYKTNRHKLHMPYVSQYGEKKIYKPRIVFDHERQMEMFCWLWHRAHSEVLFDPAWVIIKEHWYAPTEDEYEWIKDNCRILLATYGIFGVGMDVGRLDTGIEATPRGDVRQSLGRIGRSDNNRFDPEWHSFVDVITPPNPVGRFFAEPPKPYAYFVDKARVRLESYHFHKSIIRNMANL